jgi:hypothetical protein
MAVSNAAHLLLSALKASPPNSHPPSPFHMGGPQPKIGARAYVVAAVWFADRAAPFVDPRDKSQFDTYVAAAKRQLVLGVDDRTQRQVLSDAWRAKPSRTPHKIGAWAAHEATNWTTRPIYAGGPARAAAANFAKLLAKKSPALLPQLLADLDMLCIHLEALTMLDDRKETLSAPVATTLWRGHDRGKVTHWLMRLESGELALLAKLGTRWKLIEGKRDDVLASVGDAHFAAAVRAEAESGV